jgi:hypothetical protein
MVRARKPAADGESCSALSDYEFTEKELGALCRWFSAMKYAFPGTEGVMIVNHQESYSAVGLYNRAGGAPNCLVAKQEAGGIARFFWSTEDARPHVINDHASTTRAHILAIGWRRWPKRIQVKMPPGAIGPIEGHPQSRATIVGGR